jgi:hypothetical protein
MAVDGLRTGRFLLDAVATEKIGLPLGQMVMVTSPRRDRYKVSRKPEWLLPCDEVKG